MTNANRGDMLPIPYPLLDISGRLRGWPGGTFRPPGGPTINIFRPCREGEAPVAVVCENTEGDVMDCKYCYTDDVKTLILRERSCLGYETEMDICPRCGAGLTPSVPVTPPPTGDNRKGEQ